MVDLFRRISLHTCQSKHCRLCSHTTPTRMHNIEHNMEAGLSLWEANDINPTASLLHPVLSCVTAVLCPYIRAATRTDESLYRLDQLHIKPLVQSRWRDSKQDRREGAGSVCILCRLMSEMNEKLLCGNTVKPKCAW